MKTPLRIGLLVVVAVMGLVGCDDDDDVFSGIQTIHGNGNLLDEPRAVSGFTAVTLAGEGTVRIAHGAQEGLIVRAEENLLPHILSAVAGGVLEIRTEANVDIVPTIDIEYSVDVVTLERLSLPGVGEIDCHDVEVNEIEVVLEGVGTVTVNVSEKLVATVTGLGSVFYVDSSGGGLIVECTPSNACTPAS